MATVRLGSTEGRWVMTSTILASAMAFIDATALNVVLPALQKSLHATGTDLFWLLNAYLLILASLILIGGSLGDKLGRKKIYMIGILVFITGSAACGFAPNVPILIACRVIQGLGGSLMIPGSLSLISSSIDESEKGKAIGTWSAVTTIVTLGGPILGGALADAGLWRYIFFINVPIGIVALFILWKKVAESKEADADPVLDYPAVITTALGLASLTFGFLRIPAVGIGNIQAYGALALGMILLVAFVLRERRTAHPMMPLRLFANRTFSGANLLTFFLYAGLGVGMLFLSLDLVQAQGYSQLQSGLTFMPFTLLMIGIARLAGSWADKTGPRLLLIAGPATAGVGLLLLSFIGETKGPSDYWTSFFPGILVFGLGMSFTVAPLTTAVMRSVEDEYSGIASGVNNAMTRIANVFANAIFGALAVLLFTGSLSTRLGGVSLDKKSKQAAIAQAVNLGNAKTPAGISGQEKTVIEAAYRGGFIDTYGTVMRLASALAFLGALMTVLFIRNRPRASGA
ncbi:MAG TPA: MFS transporter [Puia sp.]|nr:MFS transporter [Puia sp.]